MSCFLSSFFSWFAGDMSREFAEEKLQIQKDNTYLVRFLKQLNQNSKMLFMCERMLLDKKLVYLLQSSLTKMHLFLRSISSTFTIHDKKKSRSFESVTNVEIIII